jgi:hypothetical protein
VRGSDLKTTSIYMLEAHMAYNEQVSIPLRGDVIGKGSGRFHGKTATLFPSPCGAM